MYIIHEPETKKRRSRSSLTSPSRGGVARPDDHQAQDPVRAQDRPGAEQQQLPGERQPVTLALALTLTLT